jgi:adenylate cyclase
MPRRADDGSAIFQRGRCRWPGKPAAAFPCYDGLATVNLDQGNMQEEERYLALAQDVCSRHELAPEALIVLPFLD